MNNRRGVALLFSYMVIMVLSILGTTFVVRSVSESKSAMKNLDSARAFWIAEAGLAAAYSNWSNNIAQPQGAVSFAGGNYTIAASLPEVTINGAYGGSTRRIQVLFTRIPASFENTVSSGGDLTLSGLLARVEVYGKTRISGTYSKSWGTSGWFEDKQEGVSQDTTTIKIPDYNNNGTSDEFADFVLFGQKAVQSYPANQVVYLQTNDTVWIFPDQSLVGKKVIFVQGQNPGQGNVNILFDATWRAHEDLTVISTGTVTYIEPLQFQTDARLSAVAWYDYNEASVFRSEHESVILAHDDANFVDILDWGSTSGNVIANDDVSLREVLTFEKYYYSSRAKDGDIPPGFKWLPGTVGTPTLRDWQETQIN